MITFRVIMSVACITLAALSSSVGSQGLAIFMGLLALYHLAIAIKEGSEE